MIAPINREVQEQKQHLTKMNEMREQIEDIQLQLQSAATTEQLQEQLSSLTSFASKREFIWLADIVNNKAENDEVKALRIRFEEVD